jgi:hypothetical protein
MAVRALPLQARLLRRRLRRGVTDDALVRWLAQLERRIERASPHETVITLAYVAGREVELDEEELPAALRRSVLLLAAGGDPHRGLDLEGRAVTALAAELDEPSRRDALRRGLEALRDAATNLPNVRSLVFSLLESSDTAWRAYAAALLAEDLDEE